MDVARLNFAHETPEEHAVTVGMLREAAERAGREIAVLQDVPGPKLRIGPVEGGLVELGTGTRVVLTPERDRGHGRAAAGRLAGLRRDHAARRHRLSGGWCNSAARGRGARRRGDHRRRGGRQPGLAPGPEPAERDHLAAGRERGRPAADRRRHGDGGGPAGALVRAPPRGPRPGSRAPARSAAATSP